LPGGNSAGPPKIRGYPPPEFRGHTRATAQPVPAELCRRQMTSPRGDWRSAPAAFMRGLGIVAGLARRRPVALVPEQRLIAPMRHDMVHDRRRHHAPQGPAGGTQRVPCQKGRPGPAPARTVAPARCARTLPIELPLHLRRTPHPDRTMHGGLHGQRRLHKAKPAAVPGRAGSSLCLAHLV